MQKISAFYIDKHKSFVSKQNMRHYNNHETLKSKIYDFMKSNTGFYLQLYGIYLAKIIKLKKIHFTICQNRKTHLSTKTGEKGK